MAYTVKEMLPNRPPWTQPRVAPRDDRARWSILCNGVVAAEGLELRFPETGVFGKRRLHITEKRRLRKSGFPATMPLKAAAG